MSPHDEGRGWGQWSKVLDKSFKRRVSWWGLEGIYQVTITANLLLPFSSLIHRSEQLSACVDYPMSLYWKDLARMYPNAKILLNVRDPVKWYQSVNNSIRPINTFMTSLMALPLRMLMRLRGSDQTVAPVFTGVAPTYLGPKYPRGLMGVFESGEDTAVRWDAGEDDISSQSYLQPRFFTDWVDQVKCEVSPDRLLVFQVREGWEPLCQFLGVPVPDQPFPNVNDTAGKLYQWCWWFCDIKLLSEMKSRLRSMKMFCMCLWSLAAAGVGVAVHCLKDKIPTDDLINFFSQRFYKL